MVRTFPVGRLAYMPMPDVFVIGFKCIRRCGAFPVGRPAYLLVIAVYAIGFNCFSPCRGCAPIGKFSCKFIFNIDLCPYQNPAYDVFLWQG